MVEAETRTSNRAYGALAVIGGVLAVTSYFLPNIATADQGASQPPQPSDFTLKSNWDNIYSSLTNATVYNPVSGAYGGTPHIVAAILAAFPLIMAALLALLGVWAIFQRPGPARNAILAATVAQLALASLSSFGFYGAGFVEVNAPAITLLGTLVFDLGTFIAIIAAFLAWGHKRLV